MLTKVERIQAMPLAKISTKHQITIPKKVFNDLDLAVGDLLEVTAENGKGLIVPQRVMATAAVPKLSAAEQKALKSARKKIDAINKNHLKSRGLTKTEIKAAAKVGLIDPDQVWFWTEEWQRGEREAAADIKAGRVKKFDTLDGLLKDLKQPA